MPKTHRQYGTPAHRSWTHMLGRCRNHERYIERGITVCERWLSFENFLADMGDRPDGTTLDRRDNDKGYYRENCRWATKQEQASNRANSVYGTFKGETRTIGEWSRTLGFGSCIIYKRLALGWSLERALTTPSRGPR